MAIEYTRQSKGRYYAKLVACPACGKDLRYLTVATHLLNEHTPADFGLGDVDLSGGGV